MSKKILIILISIVCFIAGTWTIVNLYNSQKAKNETKQLGLSKIDLSKVEINIEGQDLTKPFTETVSTARPEEMNIQYLGNGKIDKLNSLNSPFTIIDSLYNEIGAPTRYKSIMKNFTSYVYDDLGFYVKSDEQKRIRTYSIYFQNGKLDIAPKQKFEGDLIIDNFKVSSTTKLEELKDQFSVEVYLSSNNYYFEREEKRFVFSYDENTKKLINVMVEKK